MQAKGKTSSVFVLLVAVTFFGLSEVALGKKPDKAPGPPGGELKPRSASDLVHLSSAFGASCAGGATSPGVLIGTQVEDAGGPNSLLKAFSIPDGKVLVMTQAQVSATNGSPGDTVQFRLFRQTGGAGGAEYLRLFETLDPGGTASVTVQFPTGVVIRTLENLCARASFTSATDVQAILHGFLADDE